jgi:hypothetical protein
VYVRIVESGWNNGLLFTAGINVGGGVTVASLLVLGSLGRANAKKGISGAEVLASLGVVMVAVLGAGERREKSIGLLDFLLL